MSAVTVNDALLRQTIDALQESARAQTAAATASERMAAAVVALREENIAGRKNAVDEVKKHITADVDSREAWWRGAFKLGVAIIAAAVLFSVPLGRIIEVLLRLN